MLFPLKNNENNLPAESTASGAVLHDRACGTEGVIIMGKNPAILFYVADFIEGTTHLTHEEVGCYLRILLKQFSDGHLQLWKIERIIGQNFNAIWTVICEKFKQDKDGNFYNIRMDIEKENRKKYSESRANNRKNKGLHIKHMKNICSSYDEHMEDEDEDINKDVSINEKSDLNKGGVGGVDKANPSWFHVFEDFRKIESEAYQRIIADKSRRDRFLEINPGASFERTLMACQEFWGSMAGWVKKREHLKAALRKNSKAEIDMVATYTHAINQKFNIRYNAPYEKKKFHGVNPHALDGLPDD